MALAHDAGARRRAPREAAPPGTRRAGPLAPGRPEPRALAGARPDPRPHARGQARPPPRLDRGDRWPAPGFAVAVPELPALRAQRLRPDDARVVRDDARSARRAPCRPARPAHGHRGERGARARRAGSRRPGSRRVVSGSWWRWAATRTRASWSATSRPARTRSAGRPAGPPSIRPSPRRFLARNLDLVVPDARDRAAVDEALRGDAAGAGGSPGARAVLALLQNRDPGARRCASSTPSPTQTRELLATLSPARAPRADARAAPPRPRPGRSRHPLHRKPAAGGRGAGPIARW